MAYTRGMLTVAFGLIGAIIGSFVGVIAERVHTGQSYMTGRSRCNSCARELGPQDLIPILSWVSTAGRCRTCGAKIPALYAVLELALALIFAFASASFGLSSALLAFLSAVSVLAFIVLYDLRHTIVPSYASVLLLILSAVTLFARVPSAYELGGAFLTAGFIALGFLLLHVFSGGRAMGLGDAPVAFSLSLLVAPYAFAGLLFSFWIGALCGIAILFMRRGGPRMGIEVPFVPFLALGYLLAYFIQWNPLAFIP